MVPDTDESVREQQSNQQLRIPVTFDICKQVRQNSLSPLVRARTLSARIFVIRLDEVTYGI